MSDMPGSTSPLSEVNALQRSSAAGPARGPLDVLDVDAHAVRPPEEPGTSRRNFNPRLLWRYKVTILLVFLGLAGTALPAVWLLLSPQYEAQAVIQVRSRIPRLISRTEETGPIPQYQQYLRSQVAIISNTRVLRRALDRADVRQTEWYRKPASTLDQMMGRTRTPLARLSDDLVASSIPGTELIEIVMTADDRQDARIVANATLEEYLRFVNERFSEEDKLRIDALTQDRQNLSAEKEFLIRKLADARADLHTTSPGDLIAQRRLRLDDVEFELAELNLDIAVAQQQLDEHTPPDDASQPADGQDAETAARYEDDVEWRQLNNALKAAEHRLASARKRFGPMSDTLIARESAVELDRQKLAERETQLDKLSALPLAGTLTSADDDMVAGTSRTSMRQHIRLRTIRREHLQRYVSELRATFEDEFVTAEMLQRDRDKLDDIKLKLGAVTKRLDELDEKRQVPASIFAIARASAPTEPSSDRRIKLSIVALIGALGAGLACAFVRVAYSPQVQDAADVARDVHSAFLGYLPLHRRQDPTALEQSPVHAECVRMVRTALLNRLGQSGTNVVQVTSAMVGSGKSTLCSLLGRSLAQLGKRVLLVDADVRRPSLARRFSIDLAPGLIDILADGQTPERIRPTAFPGLSVVPAGNAQSQSDFELLANGVFSAQLDRWREEYDIILLDGAPLLGTADAAILSRHADGTIMVVREQHCRREALLEALSTLSISGGKLIGTVFVGSGGRGGYGYGYGYGYANDLAPLAGPESESQHNLDVRRDG